MRRLLSVASLWGLCMLSVIVSAPPAVPAVVPAYRLKAQDNSFLKAFRRLWRARERTDRYDALILAEARRRGLDPRLVKAVMAAESGFDPSAVSPAGARGLMQLMPATALGLGVKKNLHDPAVNIAAGAAYLAWLHQVAFRRFGLTETRYADAPYWVQKRVIAAYNAGPRALSGERWPTQTRLYTTKVMYFYSSDLTRLRAPAAVAATAK
jgi:soluble lytic murein transglycosylase-like protein